MQFNTLGVSASTNSVSSAAPVRRAFRRKYCNNNKHADPPTTSLLQPNTVNTWGASTSTNSVSAATPVRRAFRRKNSNNKHADSPESEA